MSRKKYFSFRIAQLLVDLDSPLNLSYQRSLNCASVLVQKGKQLEHRHYCNGRWCNVCNGIRTAKLINGYLPALKEYKEKWMVTLTVPNVPKYRLEDTIRNMIICFVLIKDLMRKNKMKIIGIRKLEVTFNSERKDYHPHFHFLIVGERKIAEEFLSEWMKRNPGASRKAQDIRPCDDGTLKELFKYFTKLVCKKGKGGGYGLYIRALDVIFCAMRSFRTYQPFGIKKIREVDGKNVEVKVDVAEDVDKDDLTPGEFPCLESGHKIWQWRQSETDYVVLGIEKGREVIRERLTGYCPSGAMQAIFNNIDFNSS